MKALVLGGGSLKGAWQVGAIQAVLETGFQPEMIYGISAGALNASFMVNEAGHQFAKNKTVDWDLVNKKLLRFWLENITKPADIGILKSKWSLGIDTLMSRFDGLLDTNPLHEKLKKYIDLTTLRRSPIALKVGAVNINTGEMHYADPLEQHFLDYLRASSSLPIIMPAIQIGGDYKNAFLDGGLREVVPVKKAIEDGATEIYAIATHPKKRDMEPINYRNLLSLIDRIKDISVNQFENNDLEWAEHYNESLMSIAGFSINKKIKLTVIRPDETVSVKLTEFTIDDIKHVIKAGYEKAYTVLH
ncbi:MAG: patatin-like phospholipase family protein [Cytophagaceae bacterium]|nr:patatin-like phospholipase family protein [Cytophagaceae bacterium]